MPFQSLIRFSLVTAFLALSWDALPGRAAEAKLLPGVRRVLFLGDSITYGGRFVELVDAYFATRFPDRTVEFLNLGLPSETVSGLSEEGHAGGAFPRPDVHERLDRVLEQTRPEIIIVCYGMNDGIYLPFSEGRFQKFRDGLVWVRKKATAAGAKVIHVTPPVFDEVKGGHPGYAATLDQYADWMLAQRAAGWEVIDVHGPMKAELESRRSKTPEFFLAGDGVHPNEAGHWIMARQILLHLGAKDLGGVEDGRALVAGFPHGQDILRLVEERQRLLKDAWLTATGHQRPGMNRGQPLDQAEARAQVIRAEIRRLKN